MSGMVIELAKISLNLLNFYLFSWSNGIVAFNSCKTESSNCKRNKNTYNCSVRIRELSHWLGYCTTCISLGCVQKLELRLIWN